MLELVMLAVLVLAALASFAVRHHLQVAAWDRELASAFGTGKRPEIGRHRNL